MTELSLTTGERIEWLGHRRGISMNALADLIGVERSTFYRHRKRETMPGRVVADCARELGCSADFLLGLTDYVELPGEDTGLYLDAAFSRSLAYAG